MDKMKVKVNSMDEFTRIKTETSIQNLAISKITCNENLIKVSAQPSIK